MQFTSKTESDGVLERHFVVGDATGVLWIPAIPIENRPLILLAHGGGQHKSAPGILARAHSFVINFGFTVAAIDAPGHGDRPRTARDLRFSEVMREQIAAGADVGPLVARYHAEIVPQAVAEWRATLDELLRLESGGTRKPIGFWGVSLGSAVGIALIAEDSRISAAVIGLLGDPLIAHSAVRVRIPVEFLIQWDDELVPRDSALALFDAIGSREKTLHANTGRHAELPRFESESAERFFARHLVVDQ